VWAGSGQGPAQASSWMLKKVGAVVDSRCWMNRADQFQEGGSSKGTVDGLAPAQMVSLRSRSTG
jgi:hypothetical protein